MSPRGSWRCPPSHPRGNPPGRRAPRRATRAFRATRPVSARSRGGWAACRARSIVPCAPSRAAARSTWRARHAAHPPARRETSDNRRAPTARRALAAGPRAAQTGIHARATGSGNRALGEGFDLSRFENALRHGGPLEEIELSSPQPGQRSSGFVVAGSLASNRLLGHSARLRCKPRATCARYPW